MKPGPPSAPLFLQETPLSKRQTLDHELLQRVGRLHAHVSKSLGVLELRWPTCLHLPRSFPILALKVPHPWETMMVGHPSLEQKPWLVLVGSEEGMCRLGMVGGGHKWSFCSLFITFLRPYTQHSNHTHGWSLGLEHFSLLKECLLEMDH